jgi:hypothetical protein
MKEYRVSVWASITVQAENENDAEDIAHDMVLNQEVRMRDYTFTAEETN